MPRIIYLYWYESGAISYDTIQRPDQVERSGMDLTGKAVTDTNVPPRTPPVTNYPKMQYKNYCGRGTVHQLPPGKPVMVPPYLREGTKWCKQTVLHLTIPQVDFPRSRSCRAAKELVSYPNHVIPPSRPHPSLLSSHCLIRGKAGAESFPSTMYTLLRS